MSVVVLLSLWVTATPGRVDLPAETAPGVSSVDQPTRLAKKKKRRRSRKRSSKKSKKKSSSPAPAQAAPEGTGEPGPAATVTPPDEVKSAAPFAPVAPSPPPPQPPPPERRIAVFPVRVSELQLNDVQRLNQVIRDATASDESLRVQNEKLTTSLLESSQDLGVECDVNAVECAIGLGEIADVELVVLGAAGGLDQGIGLDLRLVDVTQKKVRRRVGALLQGDRDTQNRATAEVVQQLFAADLDLAQVDLTSTPEGASVTVDGIPRGVTPLPGPLDGLWPGPHVVEVSLKGHLPDRRTMNLDPGATHAVAVALVVDPNAEVEVLVEREASVVEIAVPWAIAGGGALVAAAGAASAGAGLVPLGFFQSEVAAVTGLDQTGENYPSEVAVGWQRADTWAGHWNTWGFPLVVTGAVAGTVGLLVAAAGGVWGTSVLLFGGGDEVDPGDASAVE